MEKIFLTYVPWIFNYGSINNYAVTEGTYESILKIRSVRPVHSGQYTCVGYQYSANLLPVAVYIATAILKVFGMQFTNVEVFSLTWICVYN